jgi:DNA repair protein RadC
VGGEQNHQSGASTAHWWEGAMESTEPVYVTIRDLPEEERPRERLAKYGPEAVSTAELLAILLRTGSARESALGLAERLLSRFGSLRAIANATVEELGEIKGVGLAKSAQLKAAFELGKRLAASGDEARPAIRSPQDAAQLVMEDLRYRDREHFQTILLDTRNRVIKVRTVAVGALNANRVEPREIFKEAITHSAASVILVHNHPSGDPAPSSDDGLLTKRLVEAGQLVGIHVLDHLVIGNGRFVSLKEKNMM